MSAAAVLDLEEATRLASLDPSLAPLTTVLGDVAVRPSPAGRWELHDARWTPGAGCRLAYRVVSGADGDLWYTPDHYESFIELSAVWTESAN